MQIYESFFRGTRRALLLRAGFLVAVIAGLDWQIVGEIPLGILYLIPMLLVGSVLQPWQIAIAAAFCTGLAEAFDDLSWAPRPGVSRDLLYFIAFFGAGLFIREVDRNRRTAQLHLEEIERQSEARRDAESQLKILVESSPAAIFTADADGTVLMANEAAHRMLAVPTGDLPGRSIHLYLPSLRNVAGLVASRHFLRTVMQARGSRDDGETFLADICFSTYQTEGGLRLAAMVLDASEDLRTHEVSGLHQLLAGSRIAIGAVSHEVRNISGAIAAVYQNLSRSHALAGNRDFEALGSLAQALERIAHLNLHQTSNQASDVDLAAILEELRIVIAPMLEEEEIEAQWTSQPGLPPVWADRPSLMQVFLNLITNSVRALSSRDRRCLSITAGITGNRVRVAIIDNGGGVQHPEHLFRPFQEGAESSGLGLYLSRAFVRSFGGELHHEPLPQGACFVVDLRIAE